jgi:hypothetical protein
MYFKSLGKTICVMMRPQPQLGDKRGYGDAVGAYERTRQRGHTATFTAGQNSAPWTTSACPVHCILGKRIQASTVVLCPILHTWHTLSIASYDWALCRPHCRSGMVSETNPSAVSTLDLLFGQFQRSSCMLSSVTPYPGCARRSQRPTCQKPLRHYNTGRRTWMPIGTSSVSTPSLLNGHLLYATSSCLRSL